MHLVEMFKKQRLVGELQPLRKAEKGRADHHRRVRAQREQGRPKEKTPVAEEEVALKAATMMMRAEQQPLLEVVKVAKSLDPRMDKPPLQAWGRQATLEPAKATMKATMPPHTTRPSHGDQKSHEDNHRKRNDNPQDAPVFHGSALHWVFLFQ